MNECDKCGNRISDVDAGFSPAANNMRCECGGTWTRVNDDDYNAIGVEYAAQTRRSQEDEFWEAIL